MSFVLKSNDLSVGVFLHQPGEERGAVFAVAIRISEDFFRIEIFLIAKLFLISLIVEARLHEMQQHRDELCRCIFRLHLGKRLMQYLLCLDRHRRYEINREHRHRDVVEISHVCVVVRQ